MQDFKATDALEARVRDLFLPTFNSLSALKTNFFHDCYRGQAIGAMLHDLDRSPLVGVIPRSVFVEAFQGIFDAFATPGTFESYLAVFRAIWGPDVQVVFTVPDPGKLEIEITALGLNEEPLLERRIVNNQYVFANIVDDVGDFIVARVPRGLRTTKEASNLVFEISVAGIYTTIDLIIDDD